jgi:hypothetical protein
MFPVMMQPWFAVAGLAAVGLAIWMHLYQRTASRRVPVSSLRLVPETPQVARSRRRIQHWLLFLLRALGVVLLGAAFARPSLPQGDRDMEGGREAVVFVLDRSGSMAMRSPEGPSAWEQAVQRVRSRLAQLHPQSRVRLVCFPPTEAGEDWVGPSAMRKVVAGLTPSLAEGRPLDALREAAEALARFRSDMPESLEVVGDLQSTLERQRPALEHRREILADDQLHRQEANPLRLVDAVDPCDVRVVERGQHAGLTFKTRQPLGLTGKCVG